MANNKIFILLPDGVGLRNFANSGFYEKAIQEGLEPVFWNNTLFDIGALGLREIKNVNPRNHPLTDIYKTAKIHVELNLNIKKTRDKVYNSYRFPFSYNGIRKVVKSVATQAIITTHSSEWGLRKIRSKIREHERKTLSYHECRLTLEKEKPAMVFCTNQRHLLTVAPLLAAQDLGIPTATFIYSWDNLPKAMMCVETDYYFVWSQLMKDQLLFYYPYIKEEQILITGTPQFELHFNKGKLMDRASFYKKYGLDASKKYICFSGDDHTTSPYDPLYLEDTALAVRELNKGDFNLGIIFRRCPVDFSTRYDEILKKYADLIVPIDPLWKPMSSNWAGILPTKEDDELLSNLAEHCELVINLGSSTVFDFVAHNKPCAYFRYNQKVQLNKNWDIFKCYRYVHFRSMPSAAAVVWLDSSETMAASLAAVLNNCDFVIGQARAWFEIINLHPAEDASKRIIGGFKEIIRKNES